MTNNSIDVIVRFRVKPGQLELYKQAMDFILSTAEAKEPYVLEYSIYKNAEGVYTQYERYADEAALHRHLEGTMDSQMKWAEAIKIEQVIILGDRVVNDVLPKAMCCSLLRAGSSIERSEPNGCLKTSPRLYWRRTPRHDNRHLRLRYAKHGFAQAAAALCPMVCGKPKPEAQNLGVDRTS